MLNACYPSEHCRLSASPGNQQPVCTETLSNFP
jgi:hypothetical protein